jgi:membrane protein YqaA with SNARE-associated domain
MVEQTSENNSADTPDNIEITEQSRKQSSLLAYGLSIFGIVVTIIMIVAIIYYNDELRGLEEYGYLGAFLISILGGSTIIIPVPMLAVVFTLGGIMPMTWLLGISAAVGELIGALIIYMTGHGAGRAISKSKHSIVQRSYERLLGLIERRGPITLFILASVINPFFYPAALAAGALRFGLKRYIVIVFAGKVIKGMTIVYAGHYGLKGIFNAIGIDL